MVASLKKLIQAKLSKQQHHFLPRLENLEQRLLMSASDVYITEFMADNVSTLADEDGDFSDWIEVHNAGNDPVDITGWHLTDNATDPTKWTFPATTLDPGGFLLVFASGKDRVVSGEELHTSFGLNNNGEYLALIQPDLTVNSEYLPGPAEYPSQEPDVSYGVDMNPDTTTLVGHGDTADILIPTSEVPGWQDVSFVTDGTWIQGPTGVGYDSNDEQEAPEPLLGGGAAVGDTVLAIDFNDRSNSNVTQAGYEPFVAEGTTAIEFGDTTRTISGHDVTLIDVGGLGYDDRLRNAVINVGGLTQADLMNDFIFSREIDGISGLDLLVEGMTPGAYYSIELWSYDPSSAGQRQSDWTVNGQTMAYDYVFDGGDLPDDNDDHKMSITVQANSDGELFFSGRRDYDSIDQVSNPSFGVFLNGLLVKEAAGPVEPPLTPVLKVDFNDNTSGESGAADTVDGFETMGIDENGKTFNGGQAITFNTINVVDIQARDRTSPANNAPRLTTAQLYDDFFFANGASSAGQGMEVLVENLLPSTEYVIRLHSYGPDNGSTRTSTWVNAANATTEIIDENFSFDGDTNPSQDGMFTMEATVTTNADGELLIQGTYVDIEAGSNAVFLNALELFSLGDRLLDPAIETDITNEMEGVNAGAYLRLPFTVEAGTEVNLLNLNINYDDGFVAYLNGTEVARRNAPVGTPAYNATATDENPNGLALVGETINLTSFANLLNIGGDNVLAIHGLNIDAGDADFLIRPELIGTSVNFGDNKFFLNPTPGGTNSGGIDGFVGDTTFSHDRGHYTEAFDLVITSSTAGADIYYTTDGTVPTPESGILFDTSIPITTTTMIRAAAFLDGSEPTNVDTQTYIFLEDVIRQDPDNPLDDSAVIDFAVTDANTVNAVNSLDPWNTGVLNGASSPTLWVPRGTFGQFGTTWQSTTGDVTMIETTIDGLTPGETYQVYMNFWDADGTNAWEVRAGLTNTNLTLFTTDNSIATGLLEGNRQMFRGYVGSTVVSPEGEIKIYIDDNMPTGSADRTFFDSVGLLPGNEPLQVTGNQYPNIWQANYPGDYDMDQNVVDQWDNVAHPENTDIDIRDALLSIPTMSLVMPHEDFWDQSTGIYVNSNTRGDAWRRAASVEYFDPNSDREFQVNAGLQIHGGASRDNVRTPKHSFRLIFNPDFDGPGELEFDLFGDENVDEYNTLVLKSFFTDGFPTRTATGRYSPLDSQYLRDTYMRDSLQAMGQLDTDSTYVHLYINGLYWGLYSPVERPDDAFLAEHFGGEREDYDIVKDFNELFRGDKDEWNEMFALVNASTPVSDATYNLLQGLNEDGSPNPETGALLDIDNLIDYMISHLLAGPEDWPHHNWYAGRAEGPDSEGYKFYTWDQEIVLDGRYRDRTDVDNNFTPARLYNRLRTNDQFAARWGDRMQMHLFNDGALTVEASQARWDVRSDEIEAAIIAESARWGDTRAGDTVNVPPSTVLPTMTVDLWRTENLNVRNNYFIQHYNLFFDRMIADGLYPDPDFVSAPQFNQHGGEITSDFDISLSTDNGFENIYYTTDGSDPLNPVTFELSPTAQLYTGNINLAASAEIKTRAQSTINSADVSAMTKAFFTVDNLLRITEIHYNPAGSDDSEFIELQNTSGQTIDLTGFKFTTGVDFDFTGSAITSLAPGELVVITRNAAAFTEIYGTDAAARLAGEFADSVLQNNGENIRLEDAQGGIILEFRYEDDWYPVTDNLGASLDNVDAAQNKANYPTSGAWRPSGMDGTPGRLDPSQVALPGDANYDGLVNLEDLAKLATNFGKMASEDPFVDVRWLHGDFTGDGQVNLEDLAKLATFFGQSGSNGFDGGVGVAASDSTDILTAATESGDSGSGESLGVDWVISAKTPTLGESTWDHIGDLLNEEEDRDSLI